MQRMMVRGTAAGSGLVFHIFAMDSTSTSGAGKASVAFGSWSCRYIRNGEAISGAITPEDITTIGTYAAPTANTNIRIKAVDNTNMIGVYEVQIHSDWVNTTNTCQSLLIYLTASGVAPITLMIPLTAINPQDGVRAGLTALPNAAAEAAGGLFTRGTGAGQINQDANGRIDANVKSIIGTTLTETSAGYLSAGFKKLFDVAVPVLTAASVNQTGDSYAIVNNGTYGNSALNTDLDSIITAVAAVPTATANADALLTRDLSAVTEGSGRTPIQALRILRNKWAISGGTLTVKKEDDFTTSWTAAVTTAAGNPIDSVDPA